MQRRAAFKDHFSSQAPDYARYRPRYPAALFDHLAALAPGRELAWDCASGNGQAALGLAAHFQRVLASDASRRQIALAAAGGGIHRLAALAEAAPIAGGSVDCIAVAQALHWLDHRRFFGEVRRVARPRAVVAAWSYALCRVDPAVDEVVGRFYSEVVGEYWPPERRLVEAGYDGIDFPFDALAVPRLEMTAAWDLGEMLGYLGTWSAVARFRQARQRDPLPEVADHLASRWPAAERRTVRWPLRLRLGHVAK